MWTGWEWVEDRHVLGCPHGCTLALQARQATRRRHESARASPSRARGQPRPRVASTSGGLTRVFSWVNRIVMSAIVVSSSAEWRMIDGYSSTEDKPEPPPTKPVVKSRSWHFRTIDFGAGFGSRPDVGYGRHHPGFMGSIEVLHFGWGFDSLGGLGFTTTIWEVFGAPSNKPDLLKGEDPKIEFSSRGFPRSFVPVYVMYPVYTRISDESLYSPGIFAFAGGSAWAEQNDYLRGGLTVLWSGLAPAESFRGDIVVNLGLEFGVFYAETSRDGNLVVPNNTGGYVKLQLGYGGAWPSR